MLKKLIDRLKSVSILFQDWLRFEIMPTNDRHLWVCNRREKLALGPGRKGYVCLWPYTSQLVAPKIYPFIGKKLLNICMRDFEFEYRDERHEDEEIEISVLIGHRGLERLPHLIATLRTLAAQVDVRIECIVVEQDTEKKIQRHLPEWVRYVYMEILDDKPGYNRSAAFNFGAQFARGNLLLLHDNDMLVPVSYCKELHDIAAMGYEAINIKRFVFYLTRLNSIEVQKSIGELGNIAPEYIVQNLEAGGSMAIGREAFEKIGSMDERFVGWGGEDNEFWDRCSILKRWIWGFVPIVHLWHASQPLKEEASNPNIERARKLQVIPKQRRILELRQLNKEKDKTTMNR